MRKKLGGVSVPHLKSTAALAPELLPMPPEVQLPMSMHIGAPANPVVSVGDYVKAGQLIGEAAGGLSAHVHASISGTVKSIDNYDGLTGKKGIFVTIASDGAQVLADFQPPVVTNLTEFLEAVKNSGVVGLGGGGFPTASKLTLKDYSKLDYILVNGAECEPYITADARTMVDDAEIMWEGFLMLKKYLNPKKIIIAIESNKPEAIEKMREISKYKKDEIEVFVLPAMYPMGAEKTLAYKTVGRIVPEGKFPSDVGCIVVNCTTVAAFSKYIKTGRPLISKCITVDGSAVKNPKNVIAPIGTPVRQLFDYCGGLKDDVKKIILGGPMMGVAIPSLDMPVLKTTNAALAFSEKDASAPEPSNCIKCARCINQCPMGLMPPEIETAVELKSPERLKRFKVNLCVKCGCCAYTCPAKRPLVQAISLGKNILSNYGGA